MRRCSSFSGTESKFVMSGKEEAVKMMGLGTRLRSQKFEGERKKKYRLE